MNNKITQVCIKLAKHKFPNLTKFIDIDIDRGTFQKLYDDDKTFYQIYFYDRTYCNQRTQLISFNKNDVAQLQNDIETYNEEFKKNQELLTSVFYNDHATKVYFHFNKVGYDVGISDLCCSTRNKTIEEQQTIQTEQQHKEYKNKCLRQCKGGT